jgi:hypothetical protein
MKLPDLNLAIRELGTEAVQRYREISHSRNESAIPEIFLGGYIASRLYERVRTSIHIERSYIEMAWELGVDTPDLIDWIGGLRADIAIYEHKRPTHIVEFKIFDERNQAKQIAFDLVKARKLASLKPIAVVLGVMICQTVNANLDERTKLLQDVLGGGVEVGEAHKAVDGDWYWCFGCFCQEAASIPKT